MARKLKPSEKRRMRVERDVVKREAEKLEQAVRNHGSNSFVGRNLSTKAKELRETQFVCEMYVGKR